MIYVVTQHVHGVTESQLNTEPASIKREFVKGRDSEIGEGQEESTARRMARSDEAHNARGRTPDQVHREAKLSNIAFPFDGLKRSECGIVHQTYLGAAESVARSMAQRGHNRQGRHNLRQDGLIYILDGDRGLSLCHHLHRGNDADAEELPDALRRITTLLEPSIPRAVCITASSAGFRGSI